MSTLINICGNGRSGTTMLHVMLGNAPDAFACGEIHNWFRPWRTHHYAIECPCGQDPCPYWEKIKDAREEDFHRAVIDNLKVNYVVDQSKYIPWIVDTHKWTAAHNMKVFNILAWKDPVDLSYSYWKRLRKPMIWRRSFVRYYSKFFQMKVPYIAVNYSELVADPKNKLIEICNAVDMPYFEGKENFWEKEPHHLFGSLGIRRQVESGNSQFKAKRTFDPEFVAGLDELKARIAADAEVQAIIAKMDAHDVSLVEEALPNGHQYKPLTVYPAWYYAQRVNRALRRYYPKKFDPYAREQLETIPNREQADVQQQA